MTDDKAHILVVDDDDRLRALLKKFLSEQGFMVTVAAEAAEARRKLAWFAFDLMVLDVMMPGESGFQLLKSLKEQATPVLMLSAMSEADDRIEGLELGAEDYLAKPFEPKELVLRIKAILRRTSAQKEKARSVAFGNYRFDLATAQLKCGSESINLTSYESALLKKLAEEAGQPVSRETLGKLMATGSSERSVDVQITRLRKKLQPEEGKSAHLQTVRGTGYVLYVD